MNRQLKLPLFPEGLFDKIREAYRLQEEVKLQKEIEHLRHVVSGFKGWRTKRNRKMNILLIKEESLKSDLVQELMNESKKSVVVGPKITAAELSELFMAIGESIPYENTKDIVERLRRDDFFKSEERVYVINERHKIQAYTRVEINHGPIGAILKKRKF